MKIKKIILILCLVFQNTYCENTDLYFCTASNSQYFNFLLNMLGSLHKTNFENLKEIAVFNLGLTQNELDILSRIQKVKVYEIQKTHPDILKPFVTNHWGKTVPGWYAWKPVAIKQALDMFPYVLWIDAGFIVLKPLDDLFKHIKQNGYFLFTTADQPVNGKYKHTVEWQTTKYVVNKYNLHAPAFKWILKMESINAGLMGASRSALNNLIMPLYELTKDLRNFQDDGSTPEGFGTCRHDQALLAILGYTKGLKVFRQDYTQKNPIYLDIDNLQVPIYTTWNDQYVSDKTSLYHSRFDPRYNDKFKEFLKYKTN